MVGMVLTVGAVHVWQNRALPRQERLLPVREPPSAEQRAVEVALLGRVRDGDATALSDLYGRFGGPLYSLAYQIVRDAGAAEDIVQEVFMAVWRDAGRFDPAKGSPAGWLFALTRHKVDRPAPTRDDRPLPQRRGRPDARARRVMTSSARSGSASAATGRSRASTDLSAPQREALELAFFGGLTHVEVADRLGIPLGHRQDPHPVRVSCGFETCWATTVSEDPA